MKVGRQNYNICFVDDGQIRELNAAFRGIARATDVLSFPWRAKGERGRRAPGADEFKNFLGDLVISTESARRNARAEGHSTRNEVRWLILHGLLHLLGYDHETDGGEMTELEHSMRERLGLIGRTKGRNASARRARPDAVVRKSQAPPGASRAGTHIS